MQKIYLSDESLSAPKRRQECDIEHHVLERNWRPRLYLDTWERFEKSSPKNGQEIFGCPVNLGGFIQIKKINTLCLREMKALVQNEWTLVRLWSSRPAQWGCASPESGKKRALSRGAGQVVDFFYNSLATVNRWRGKKNEWVFYFKLFKDIDF